MILVRLGFPLCCVLLPCAIPCGYRRWITDIWNALRGARGAIGGNLRFSPSDIPGSSHSRNQRLLLAIPHAPPACFVHRTRQASVPSTPANHPFPKLKRGFCFSVCNHVANRAWGTLGVGGESGVLRGEVVGWKARVSLSDRQLRFSPNISS